jgi:peptide chain release factor 2
VVHFDIDQMRLVYRELEEKTLQNDFWNDAETAQQILKKAKGLKDKLELYEGMYTQMEELELFSHMVLEEGEESLEKDILEGIKALEMSIDQLTLETLLSGEYDKNNAILSVHAGSGGLDAQDWAEMIFRMYHRWAEGKGYKVRILDMIRDTAAGVKSVSLLIEGENAYGFLKSEKGVHRLVRISPFDSSGKRHTSFASVDVMPEMDDSVSVEIDSKDLRIDTFRASGAGGQHINMTDSAVRITHLPTGIVVGCQNERSQHSNKATAMKVLTGKLIELKEREHKEKIEDLAGDYSQIAWGSQIRSYVFNPYNLVKDHRTGAEMGSVHAVMDGELDLFINAWLKNQKEV